MADKREGTRIQGLFKIGFKTSNMNALLEYLSKIKVPVEHVWGDPGLRSRNFLINDPDGNFIQFYE